MYRSNPNILSSKIHAGALNRPAAAPVNAIGDLDDFVTAEPTPKPESRRGWRRRRVRRGKS